MSNFTQNEDNMRYVYKCPGCGIEVVIEILGIFIGDAPVLGAYLAIECPGCAEYNLALLSTEQLST